MLGCNRQARESIIICRKKETARLLKVQRLLLEEEITLSFSLGFILQISSQRLTFPFPFVHHQPPDWKVEQLLTMETRILLCGLTIYNEKREQERRWREKTHASSPSTSGKTYEKPSVIQTRRSKIRH